MKTRKCMCKDNILASKYLKANPIIPVDGAICVLTGKKVSMQKM